MGKEIWIWIKEKLAAAGRWIGAKFKWVFARLFEWLRGLPVSVWKRIAIFTPIAFVLYIILGMMIVHRIGDDLSFKPTVGAGESHAVGTIIALVEREAKHNGWTPNDPIFLPGWWIDNTPNYQKGMLAALSRFSIELRDQIGRVRGSSAEDEDLKLAAGQLAIEPDRWFIDFSTSLLPTRPSDQFYREAAEALRAYNARLATGNAVFERRSDNLLATLDRIALDLGSSSAALEEYIGDNAGGFLPDFGADDLFYEVKGQVYAYTMLLEAMRLDFADIIEGREIGPLYDELLNSMRAAVEIDPFVVTNGGVDGMLANHLSRQGFYLLRARTQMREVTNILLK